MKKDVNLTRRKFLVKSASAVVGGATAGVLGSSIIRPSTAYAQTPPTLPLPYCKDSGGNPTTTPSPSNTTVLDPDDVRVNAWKYFHSGKG